MTTEIILDSGDKKILNKSQAVYANPGVRSVRITDDFAIEEKNYLWSGKVETQTYKCARVEVGFSLRRK